MSRELKKYALWKLTISPALWGAHFLLCYIAAAIWCAKNGRAADLGVIRNFIYVVTMLSLVAVFYQIVKSYREHKEGESELPHDGDSPDARDSFLGYSNLLISALSALAILFVAFNAVVFRSCQ